MIDPLLAYVSEHALGSTGGGIPGSACGGANGPADPKVPLGKRWKYSNPLASSKSVEQFLSWQLAMFGGLSECRVNPVHPGVLAQTDSQ